MALVGAGLTWFLVNQDVQNFAQTSWADLPLSAVVRGLVFMAVGGALVGWLLAGLFGRSGLAGWALAAVGGVAGTVLGIAVGCLFSIYFTPIFDLINWAAGGGVWDPTVRPIYHLSAKLQWHDVLSATVLSLILSFAVTIFPARRAARMNPVEALRYE